MKHVHSHTFRGKKYKIRWRKLPKDDGACDPPTNEGKMITIDPHLSDADLLETLIHEATHACQWDLADDAVNETSHDIARFLSRCGFKR